MPQHTTKTSFKPGHKRSAESIAKQVETMKRQYASGERTPPRATGPNPKKGHRGMEHYEAKPIGTRRVTDRGYIQIKLSPTGPWLYEHRYVAEQIHGRLLASFEHVHHVNGDPADNRPENLIVLTAGKHQVITNRNRGYFKSIPKCPVCGWHHPPHD